MTGRSLLLRPHVLVHRSFRKQGRKSVVLVLRTLNLASGCTRCRYSCGRGYATHRTNRERTKGREIENATKKYRNPIPIAVANGNCNCQVGYGLVYVLGLGASWGLVAGAVGSRPCAELNAEPRIFYSEGVVNRNALRANKANNLRL